MASVTTHLTITPDELTDLLNPKVEPGLHDTLAAEVLRRWPHGMAVHVHLAAKPQSTD